MKIFLLLLIIVCSISIVVIVVRPEIMQPIVDPIPMTIDGNEPSSNSKPIQLELTEIEIADNDKSRQQGLQNRKELCETCAMLFVFDTPAYQSFWMLNTYISLDMLFVDQDGVIVTIYQDTKPLDTSLRYKSTQQAKYVIEVPSGYTKKYDLQAGNKIDIEDMKNKGKPFVWEVN